MAQCKKIRSQRRQICTGDLDRIITVEFRTITAPTSGVDFDESFTLIEDVGAMIKSVRGETAFDKTNTERVITDNFYIRFRSDVSAETWVEFQNDKYDIVDTEDLDKRHEFMLLKCTKRGINTNPANFA